jgi:hypothetical protein
MKSTSAQPSAAPRRSRLRGSALPTAWAPTSGTLSLREVARASRGVRS